MYCQYSFTTSDIGIEIMSCHNPDTANTESNPTVNNPSEKVPTNFVSVMGQTPMMSSMYLCFGSE